MKATSGQLATACLAEREALTQLLLFNLFLQFVDGIFSYSKLSNAASVPLSWSPIASIFYYKLLAALLLLLIAWLGKRKPDLAVNALVVCATIYTAFAIYSIYCLIP